MQQKNKAPLIIVLLIIVLCTILTFAWYATSVKYNLGPAIDDLPAASNVWHLVSKTYPDAQIDVSVQGRDTLKLTLADSDSINSLSYPEQQLKAQEIAAFAKDNFKGNLSLNYVIIEFIHHNQVGTTNIKIVSDYTFDAKSLH
jgi:hypothetical protein